MTEDEKVGWHHCFNGHDLGQTLGDGEGQGGLACCSPWGHKELGHNLMTEKQQQNATKEQFCSSSFTMY